MTLESSKNLGGIGAILIVIGMLGVAIPYAGILALIGLILLLIGLKGLADYYKEGGIFNNTLYAIILAIVGAVVAAGVFIVTALAALSDIIGRTIDLSNVTDLSTLGTELTNRFTNFTDFGAIWALVGAAVAALIIIFVFAILAVIFFRRSLSQLSSKTGVGMFGTAGLLMLIGAVLTIIVIGALLIWIAWILVAVAFFSIKSQPAAAPPPPPTPPQ